MPKDQETIKCRGCGVLLQSDDPKKLGYIPRLPDNEAAVCQRCFRISHYNEASRELQSEEDFLSVLNRIADTSCLVVHIVDLFDFEGSLISGLSRFVGHNPIVLVANKIDLLPKNVNPNKIVNWLRQQAKEAGLKPLEIIICSAKKGLGYDRLIHAIQAGRDGKDVYVVGATNVGKSSLINRLIRDYSELQGELTVSRYPGTTLDLVKIPLEDGKSIIDTPGVVYRHRMSELVSVQDLKTIMPEKPLKPVVYQLKEQQTLFFGALARFDYYKGENMSFSCFTANSLNIHRTKLEKADELYALHKGEMLSPPHKDELDKLPAWTVHRFKLKGDQDVLISGLGWIKVNGSGQAEVAIHAPKGVRVAVRPSMI